MLGESRWAACSRVWEDGVTCYVCVCRESGFSVLMAGPGICSCIAAHHRCTQCSIMLYLIDICFLTCICLWQIFQIQTCLCVVVGHGLVSTSPAFMRSIASHPAVRMASLAQKTVIGYPAIAGDRRGRHNLHRVCQTAETARPRVGCVVWSQKQAVNPSFHGQPLRLLTYFWLFNSI